MSDFVFFVFHIVPALPFSLIHLGTSLPHTPLTTFLSSCVLSFTALFSLTFPFIESVNVYLLSVCPPPFFLLLLSPLAFPFSLFLLLVLPVAPFFPSLPYLHTTSTLLPVYLFLLALSPSLPPIVLPTPCFPSLPYLSDTPIPAPSRPPMSLYLLSVFPTLCFPFLSYLSATPTSSILPPSYVPLSIFPRTSFS